MKYVFPVIAISLLLSFCTSKQENTPVQVEHATQPENTDSLKIAFEAIKLNLDTSWVNIDSGFIELNFSLNRLLQEIEYTKNYDPSTLTQLKDRVSTLSQFHYKQERIPDFETVGMHDEAADEIVSLVTTYAITLPDKDNYPLIEELVADIDRLNSQEIITYRTHYSNAVTDYNTFIGEHGESLKTLGYQDLTPLPSYFLMQ